MDAGSLLECWEQGRRRHPLDRALLLHAMAAPDEDRQTLADRPLGERNAALLRLRQSLFGDALKSCVDCPECDERLEFTLSASTLLERAPAEGDQQTQVEFCGRRLRLPTTRDLASLVGEDSGTSATSKLLQRLGLDDGLAQLNAELESKLEQMLDETDPCIDFAIALTCPACSHEWSASFDVPGFLWEEVDVRARRLLDEVHVLARSYGWSEGQILALSDTRRHAYLERALA